MTAEITKPALLPDSPDFLQHLSSIISLLATALCGEELWQRALAKSQIHCYNTFENDYS